jgi:hypothetical protein
MQRAGMARLVPIPETGCRAAVSLFRRSEAGDEEAIHATRFGQKIRSEAKSALGHDPFGRKSLHFGRPYPQPGMAQQCGGRLVLAFLGQPRPGAEHQPAPWFQQGQRLVEHFYLKLDPLRTHLADFPLRRANPPHLQLRSTAEDAELAHILRIHQQNLDIRAKSIHPRYNPPDAGTEQIARRQSLWTFFFTKEYLMRYRKLGPSGLLVSELCLGTMTFGGSEGMWGLIGQLRQEEADALVKTAVEAGINFFDTANVYAGG